MSSVSTLLKAIAAILAAFLIALLIALLVGVPLFALPATLSLGWGIRPGLKRQILQDATHQLRKTGLTGWDLVEAARFLVAERMQYCRRNSFDPAPRAFARGYGYCQQQAYALMDILTRLGFEARVVGAYRNRFPDGERGGHAWVQVSHAGESRHIDSLHYDPVAGKITFTPLSEVFAYTSAFRLLAGWGSVAVNAYRYYVSGKDC